MDVRRIDTWRKVNAFCLTSSVLFFGFMLLNPNVNDTKSLYMIYDVTMTFVWCLEVVDRRQQLATSDYMFYVEFSLAVIFLIDGCVTLSAWNFKSEKIYMIFIDLILNSAAYTYFLITTRNESSYAQPEAPDNSHNIIPSVTASNPAEK